MSQEKKERKKKSFLTAVENYEQNFKSISSRLVAGNACQSAVSFAGFLLIVTNLLLEGNLTGACGGRSTELK